jgi:hypothetical protein
MKVEAQAPDVEHLVKEYLQDVMAEVDCTISIGVPAGWTKESTPHLEVASDGRHFIRGRSACTKRSGSSPVPAPLRKRRNSALAARAGSSLTTATAKSSAPDS